MLPLLNLFRSLSYPFRYLTNNFQWRNTAIRSCGIAGEFFVGNIRIIFKTTCWLDDLYPLFTITFRKRCSKSCAIRQCSKINVIHDRRIFVIWIDAGRQQIAYFQIRLRSMIKRSVVSGHVRRWNCEFRISFCIFRIVHFLITLCNVWIEWRKSTFYTFVIRTLCRLQSCEHVPRQRRCRESHQRIKTRF